MKAPRLRRELRLMTGEAVASSFMLGAGEAYVAALLLSLGGGAVAAGLVATVPLLGGAAMQLAAPWVVWRIGSYRRWVMACASIQAASLVPFAVAAFLGLTAIWTLFIAAAIYWAASMAASAAWNSWVGRVVPARLQTRYLARRARWGQAGTLSGILLAVPLFAFFPRTQSLTGFGFLFAAAVVARIVSTLLYGRQAEPGLEPPKVIPVPPTRAVSRLLRGTEGRFLRYVIAVQAAVCIGSPFFSAYMLGPLHLTGWQYAALLATSFVGKIAGLSVWGTVARRHGPHSLIVIGGIGIIPAAGLWIVSDAAPYLFALQLAGGFAWGAYELAVMLLILHTLREEERPTLLSLYFVGYSLASVGGALVGGFFYDLLGRGTPAFHAIFLASSVARLLTVALLVRVHPKTSEPVTVVLRIVAVRPLWGAVLRPVVTSSKRPEPKVRADTEA